MNNNIILGLDVSTSCIGVCVFNDDGSKDGKILKMSQILYKSSEFKNMNGIETFL